MRDFLLLTLHFPPEHPLPRGACVFFQRLGRCFSSVLRNRGIERHPITLAEIQQLLVLIYNMFPGFSVSAFQIGDPRLEELL